MKLTIVGRVSDGLPLAQAPLRMDEENSDGDGDISAHKQQAEFLLLELSRRALPPSKITIFLDHDNCFNCIVEDGICFMALFDSMYPRNLAFCYLRDLHKEFLKFEDVGLIQSFIRPYSFVRFDNVIANVGRKYVDTRSQANLKKINSDASQDADVITESFSRIVQRRRRLELFERISEAHLHSSPIWCSKRLEMIALKWIPIGLVLAVTSVVIWTSFARDGLLSTGLVYF